MTDIGDKIRALDRELNISMLDPWKVVGGFVVVAGAIILGATWWCQPDMIKDNRGEMCTKKVVQFCIAIAVGLGSLAWLLWGWYQG